MDWGWQDVASVVIVAAASFYLVVRFAPWPSKKASSGCGACPLKSAAGGHAAGGCGTHSQVVSIGLSAPSPRRAE